MSGVTSRDVAREAGVSQNTVSLVLRDSPRVREETKAAVRRAAERLGYRSNGLAAALRSRSTPMVLFVVAQAHVHDHVTAGLLAGAIEGAEARGCSVIVLAEDVRAPGRAAEAYRSRWASGAVVIPAAREDPLTASLVAAGCPTVVLARPPAGWPADRQVRADDPGGARQAVQHLLGRGHRRIGIVGVGTSGTGLDGDRVSAARAAAEAAGAAVVEVPAGGWTREHGQEAARRLLAADPRPTALFAVSDRLAFGALAVAAGCGLRVPADLAVVGFDNVEWAEWSDPPLTTVEFPLREIGRRGVGLVLGGSEAGGAAVPTRLVVRRSS